MADASCRICSRPVFVAVPGRVDALAFEEAGLVATELGFFFAMKAVCHFSANENTHFLANSGRISIWVRFGFGPAVPGTAPAKPPP